MVAGQAYVQGMASGPSLMPRKRARWVILAIHTCIGHLLRLKRASRRPQGQRSCDSSKLHPIVSSPPAAAAKAATLPIIHRSTHRCTRASYPSEQAATLSRGLLPSLLTYLPRGSDVQASSWMTTRSSIRAAASVRRKTATGIRKQRAWVRASPFVLVLGLAFIS